LLTAPQKPGGKKEREFRRAKKKDKERKGHGIGAVLGKQIPFKKRGIAGNLMLEGHGGAGWGKGFRNEKSESLRKR